MVEQWEREQEEKKARQIKSNISNKAEPNENLAIFMDGYNHALDTHFKLIENTKAKKEELQDKRKRDILTDTMLRSRVEELDQSLNQSKNKTEERITELFNKFKEIYIEQSTPKGNNLNDDDVKLLQSGIELTKEELQIMADKYNKTGNETMKRLILKHSKELGHHIYVKDQNSYIDTIDQLLNQTKKGLENNDSYYGRYIGTPHHRETLLNQFKEKF